MSESVGSNIPCLFTCQEVLTDDMRNAVHVSSPKSHLYLLLLRIESSYSNNRSHTSTEPTDRTISEKDQDNLVTGKLRSLTSAAPGEG